MRVVYFIIFCVSEITAVSITHIVLAERKLFWCTLYNIFESDLDGSNQRTLYTDNSGQLSAISSSPGGLYVSHYNRKWVIIAFKLFSYFERGMVCLQWQWVIQRQGLRPIKWVQNPMGICADIRLCAEWIPQHNSVQAIFYQYLYRSRCLAVWRPGYRIHICEWPCVTNCFVPYVKILN